MITLKDYINYCRVEVVETNIDTRLKGSLRIACASLHQPMVKCGYYINFYDFQVRWPQYQFDLGVCQNNIFIISKFKLIRYLHSTKISNFDNTS